MTTRTLPITPGSGLVLVHQPTSRYSVQRPSTRPTSSATVLWQRIARWWRQVDGTELAWQQQRLLRESRLDADAYTWTLRNTR